MRPILLFAGFLLVAAPALADGHRLGAVRDPLVLKECGQCHMAFQPGLLPALSWERVMGNLADHFGDDASLSTDKTAAIRTWLVANAGRARHGEVPERITTSRWFVHEHDFPAKVWQRPGVVAKSNCPACHGGAEQGLYDDD